MTRIIKIESCKQCQYSNHSGGFTPGGPIPLCGKIGFQGSTVRIADVFNQRGGEDQVYPNQYWSVLPFNMEYDSIRKRNLRKGTGKIPNWCPLEKYNASR